MLDRLRFKKIVEQMKETENIIKCLALKMLPKECKFNIIYSDDDYEENGEMIGLRVTKESGNHRVTFPIGLCGDDYDEEKIKLLLKVAFSKYDFNG